MTVKATTTIRKPRGKVLRLIQEYADNEAFLDANDKVVQRSLAQREKLAAQIVKVWGEKPLSFGDARYVPSKILGKTVLRRFVVHRGSQK